MLNQLSFQLLLSHTSAKHYEIRTKHTISFKSDTRLEFTCVTCCFSHLNYNTKRFV